MSKEIYKSIEWAVAAKEAGEGNADKLFIKGRNDNLYNASDMDLEIGELSKRSWYLRCEQREEHHTNDIDLPIRPEVSE